jgi:recombination protein RecT
MTKALAKINDERGVEQFIVGLQRNLSKCAVRDYKQERFLRSAVIAIASNKDLMEIAQTDRGRIEISNALKAAAITGLSLNPQEKKAALVIYGTKTEKEDYRKVQYQTQKDGLIDLALETGLIKTIVADRVFENDAFKIKKHVDSDTYSFEPAIKNRGEVIGYFAAASLLGGVTRAHWMTREEVEEHSNNYSSAKRSAVEILNDPKAKEWMKRKAEKSPWIKSFDGMALKTVIRSLLSSKIYLPDNYSRMLASDQDTAPVTIEGTVERIEDNSPGVSPEQITAQLQQDNSSEQEPEENEQKPKDAF